ncbi:MAG: hypothetical protein KatS3mg110_3107 [Pirellulaceae bacterium]|nr:MAG: hypothetical protein KatS3mg110_3107 [Pirellulaceae bacterium]
MNRWIEFTEAEQSAEKTNSASRQPSAAIHAYPYGQFFCPLHYEPGYGYPLLVWLHSDGTDEQQLVRIIPWISLRNYVAVAPQAPLVCEESGAYCWPDSACDSEVWERVRGAIQEATARFAVRPDKVYIAGYERGGTTALRIALEFPEYFAGAASIQGPFPYRAVAFVDFEKVRRLPLWVAQGADSHYYPSDRLAEDMRLVHAAGMTAQFRQYSCGDVIHVRMLQDLDRWLMELSAGVHQIR